MKACTERYGAMAISSLTASWERVERGIAGASFAGARAKPKPLRTPFAGTFDGAGHTVSGLKITSTQGADYAIGLFGILDGATVKDLTVADAKIAVPQSELAGILCGMLANDSTVSRSTSAPRATYLPS